MSGYVVVDFTQILAGPYCTQLLADAGATVIKVEPPGGEFSRVRGHKRRNATGGVLSSYSAAVNRGKRSICLDLKNPTGLDLALKLIDRADVVIENFAPGAFAPTRNRLRRPACPAARAGHVFDQLVRRFRFGQGTREAKGSGHRRRIRE